MMEYKMVEQFEYKGVWFLPTAKSNRVSGTLYYNADEGITLELSGDFNEIDLITIDSKEYDIILGLTSDSKEITLYKSFLKSKDGMRIVINQEIGTPSTSYYVQYALEGIHIDRPEDIKFDMLESGFINLDEWIGITGFDFDAGREIERRKNNEYQINYRIPEPITFQLSNDLEGQFNFCMKDSGRSFYQKTVTIEQKVLFVMKYKEERTLDIILDDLFKFQRFLVLALYGKTMPKNIQIYNENYKKDYGNNIFIPKKIKLFSRFRTCNTPQKMFMDMLFCYKEIKDIFPEIIKNWFDKYKDFKSAINLLVNQFYIDVFAESDFLNLAQAVESFHAHTERNRPQIPKVDYDAMKEHILNVVDETYHKWLKGQFDIGNYLTLHTRLEDLFSFWSCEALDKIIGDKDVFIRQVKNSRNYYTHYFSGLKKNALTGWDLFDLTQRLKLVLTCAFLIEVGIDKAILDKLFNNRWHKFSCLIPKKNPSSTASESK